MSKSLVAYFSASGRTRQAAENLADAAGADLYEICPEQPYTEADLNWSNRQSRSTEEQQDSAARPALADHSAPVAEHDTIFVGFPIWWYTAPAVVRSFLDAYDFSGKNIILFATSGGSGLGQTIQQLQSIVPGAHIRDGRVLNGAAGTQEAVRQWVEKLSVK